MFPKRLYIRTMKFCAIFNLWLLLALSWSCDSGTAGGEETDVLALVYTSDNTYFEGYILEENDKSLVLRTETLGDVEVEKQKIIRKTDVKTGRFTDERDQQQYTWVQYNHLQWMQQNLRVDVPGSYCPDGNCGNLDDYGRLYEFNVACKVCPQGWRLPSDEEWQQLEKHLGIDGLEASLRGSRSAAPGIDVLRQSKGSVSFSLSGARYGDKDYRMADNAGFYWTSSVAGIDGYAWVRVFYKSEGSISRNYYPTGYAMAVRCVRQE